MAVERAGPVSESDREHLARLEAILGRARGAAWSDQELLLLPRLYRHACSVLARLQATGEDPRGAAGVRVLISRAHAVLYRPDDGGAKAWMSRLVELFLVQSPRAIRAEWRLLALSLVLDYGFALLAWFAVSHDLDLAPSLLDPRMVEQEIEQLQETARGEPFRGNFNFGFGASPLTAGMIVLHNIGVGILFFASALVPPVYFYIVSVNGLMLGSYTAVAGHWGQAGAISSILWTHGVLEIQALVLAGTAGLCLVRAWVRPGPWTRRHALQRESKRALELFAPVFPLLVIAGLIEGFVTPHAPLAVRVTVAIASGVGLVAWVLLGGRRREPVGAARARP